MDCVQETPAKRRKLVNGDTTSSHAYDSQNDSGDDIFDDYETVATIPLPTRPTQQDNTIDPISSPPTHVTQPTQVISKVTAGRHDSSQSTVQVAASSPLRVSNTASPTPSKHNINVGPGGRIANMMAPAGTAFRPPPGIAKAAPIPAAKAPQVHDISDDDLPLYNDSSEEDSQSSRKADIKPSEFIQSAQKSFAMGTAKKGETPFKEIISSSFYNPTDKGKPKSQSTSTLQGSVFDNRNRDEKQTTSQFAAPKRSADTMANAYGGASRPPPKQPRQTGPAKALPAQDIELNDIPDYQLRSKIQRIRAILPYHSVRACKHALEIKRFNFDDAMEFLADQEGDPMQIDLTLSDDDGQGPPAAQATIATKKPTAKQQLKAPNQKIQEKWTATQIAPKVNQPSSPLASASSVKAPPKPRRRLVQGRKNPSSPASTVVPPKQPSPVPSIRSATPEDSDSALGESDPDTTELDNKVLKFFNTCSVADLTDIAAITEEVATVMLSQKPFETLDEVRQISGVAPPKRPAKPTKRKSIKKPIGDKIVEKCLDMWTGYDAVDELVRRCEALGKPVKEDMKSWGVSALGASGTGELDMVSFERDNSPRDSGIGTPTSLTVSDEEEGEAKRIRRHGFFPQPSILAKGVHLKDYQVVGVNWLSLLFHRKLSCILADDMGLGKTCQVIAFLAHLKEKGIKGPHLVVVPASTLENWLREFSVFCPELHVMPYYASQNERPGVQAQILDALDTLNVIVTTYTLAKTKDDNKFLRRLKPVVCVYDEGHILKNSKSAGYDALMRIQAEFRLLLTGTPLQNNLSELASLLGFILPAVFKEHTEELEAIFSHKAKTTDDSHAALLSNQRIARAKSMMTPFVLRRKKHQVLKHLPAKTRRIEYCDLSASQSEIYKRETAKASRIVAARAAGEKVGNETANVMMSLRKASIHPLLFRRIYDDETIAKMSKACLKEEQYKDSNPQLVYEDMGVMTDMELHRFCEHNPKTMSPYLLRNDEWMDSGKVKKLASLLQEYKRYGDRVLVFSQFVMVMDILEAVMENLEMAFFRLDGSTNINERQDMIDQFYKEEDITVFLLSTGAGGAGINLACANKVIIFDSSFNPQSDIQAENRAHRVGQTREVEVVRLVTRNTIEEQIHALGETKLALDDRVAGVVEAVADDKKAEKQGAKLIEEMMIGKIEKDLKGAKEVVEAPKTDVEMLDI